MLKVVVLVSLMLLSVCYGIEKAHKGEASHSLRHQEAVMQAVARAGHHGKRVMQGISYLWIPHPSRAQEADAASVAAAKLFSGRVDPFKGVVLIGAANEPLSVVGEGDKLYILCHGTETRPSQFMTDIDGKVCSGAVASADNFGEAKVVNNRCKKYYSADQMASLLIAAGLGKNKPGMVYDIDLLSCGAGGIYPPDDCATNCQANDKACQAACNDFMNYDNNGVVLPLAQLLGASLATKAPGCKSILISGYSRSTNEGQADDGNVYGMGIKKDGQFGNIALSGDAAYDVEPIVVKHRSVWGILSTDVGYKAKNPYYNHFNNACPQ